MNATAANSVRDEDTFSTTSPLGEERYAPLFGRSEDDGGEHNSRQTALSPLVAGRSVNRADRRRISWARCSHVWVATFARPLASTPLRYNANGI